MNILGISAFYHDSAACLVRDGEIISAAQEERFTRKKHDHSFPVNAIRFCLASNGLTVSDINIIAFYEKPFMKFERILETYLDAAPRGIRSFLTAMPLWIKQKLWLKDYIAKELQFKGTIIFPQHHESHAASAFYPSPFKRAAFLTLDAVGEWSTTSYGTGLGNAIRMLADIEFPHSLGLLYSAFTYYCGFKVNSGEYKLMGLAPYGEPVYRDTILSELIDVKDDGSFRLNLRYFDFGVGMRMINKRFEKLFGGPARKPESKITQRHMDCARSIQDVIEHIIVTIARHVKRVTNEQNLCLAGGVALNCVANSKILRTGLFEKLWIQPASGDAGGALGAALLAWYQYLGKPRIADDVHDQQKGSFLGPQYSEDEIVSFLDSQNIPYEPLAPEVIPERIANLINAQNVIGWFSGRMEFGPRALGARSILADARSPAMQKLLNLKIKFRESFRPFAPSVLAEKASEYFTIDRESPYMLLIADVHEQQQKQRSKNQQTLTGLEKLQVERSTIPAVTHVDFSARLQTVHRETNPQYHALLTIFDKKYRCPVIINTSFNVRGEPIVCSPHDAFTCFMNTHMDYLLLERFLISKKDVQHLQQVYSVPNLIQSD